MYGRIEINAKYTKDYKMYITRDGNAISPWHDIELFVTPHTSIVNCVNEIPRFENAKFEASKTEILNPITQDISKGALRFLKNIFPYKGMPFNYGYLPQTWEDPSEKDKLVDAFGDNDPLDVVEIGRKQKMIGSVYQARILGCLGLLDDGEMDWKILVVDINDEELSTINSVEDLQIVYPKLLSDIVYWFKNYKIPDGKPSNQFAFGGEYLDVPETLAIINNCHMSWKKLMRDGYKDIAIINAKSDAEIPCISIGQPLEKDSSTPEFIGDTYYFRNN